MELLVMQLYFVHPKGKYIRGINVSLGREGGFWGKNVDLRAI
jgi:hypothetical protein